MKARQWISVLFILVILAFAQTQCLAAVNRFLTGNDLVECMRLYEQAVEQGRGREMPVGDVTAAYGYMAYIVGVYQASCLIHEGHMYSMPSGGGTNGQFIAVVSKYLKNHPEQWNEFAVVLVIRALQEAFPFKTEEGGK